MVTFECVIVHLFLVEAKEGLKQRIYLVIWSFFLHVLSKNLPFYALITKYIETKCHETT